MTSLSGGVVLVLGCASTTAHGRDQMHRLTEQAHRRGLRVWGADHPANLAAGPCPADEVVALDVGDPAAVDAWARMGGRRADAVTTFREMSVEAAAVLAARWQLPGNDAEAVRIARDKARCRAALAGAGLPQPACRLVSDLDEARRFLAETGPGPWIVKPPDGMGSVGVSAVAGPHDLPAALALLAPGAPFVVEQFVAGPEFSAEGVVRDGAAQVLALTAKHTGPGFVEVGHRMPAPLPPATSAAAEHAVTAAVEAVGLCYGAFHVEFWLVGDGVVLGEVHARPGGDFLHALLEEVRPGLEFHGRVLDDLLGAPAVPPPPVRRAAGVDFLVPAPGRVRAVAGLDGVRAHPGVLVADLSVRPGDTVRRAAGSQGRAGAVVVGGRDLDEVDRLLLELGGRIHVEVEETAAR